jgi:hypothetical protein
MSPASINDSWGGGSRPPAPPVVQANAPAPTINGGDVFDRADAHTHYAARKFGEHVKQVHAQPFDERDKAAVIESFADTQAAKAAHAAVAEAAAERDRLAEAVADARDRIAPPGDTAGQLHAQRVWERGRHALDAASRNPAKTVATARNLIRDAKPDELAVYVEEVKPWLAAEGHPTDWLDGEIARAAPEYAAAKVAHRDAERKVIKLQHNARVTANAYKSGRPLNDALLVDPS